MNSGILYPNVTSLPGQSGVAPATERPVKKQDGVAGEFDQAFEKALNSTPGTMPGLTGTNGASIDLNQVKSPLKFSAHASQRLADRKITLDSSTMAKVSEAVDKADAKGVEDTLVLTKDAALIVNVKNRTVI